MHWNIQEPIWMTISYLVDLIVLLFSYFRSSFCHILYFVMETQTFLAGHIFSFFAFL